MRKKLSLVLIAVVFGSALLSSYGVARVDAGGLIDLKISPEAGSMFTGHMLKFNAVGVYSDGSQKKLEYPEVTWDIVFMHPDDPTAAKIDKNGLLIVCKAPLNLRVAATEGGTSARSAIMTSNRAQIAVPAQARDALKSRKIERNKDGDNDGLMDRIEAVFETDPNNSDTDDDGHRDGEEVLAGFSPIHSGKLYRDQGIVPSWAQEKVFELASKGVIRADNKGNINPRRNITRGEFLQMIMDVADIELESLATGEGPFIDVVKDDPTTMYINHAYALGLASGHLNDTFRPNAQITRAEAIKLVIDGLRVFWYQHYMKMGDMPKMPFKDINETWQIRYIDAAKKIDLVKGYSDGTFRPDKNINLAEAAKLLHFMLSHQEGSTDIVEGICGSSN